MAKVLLIGAAGLFGGHLARQLAARGDIELVVAGRTEPRLRVLGAELSCGFRVMDRRAASEAIVAEQPFAVVDCSGPFQSYGANPYAVAEAALDAGAHYLDIADAPGFVEGITRLDRQASNAGLCAFSGASTTPALSSAIATDLVEGLDEVSLIETAVLPGNQTPRGLSVMQAILGQVGQRFSLRRAGRDEAVRGWSDSVTMRLRVGSTRITPRRAALVNTPDSLLAEAFGAKTVRPRAGLELGLFHVPLSIAQALRLPLGALARPLLAVADRFQGLGTDTGGMRVRVIGWHGARIEERVWDMILPDGHGPKTPVQPIVILLNKLLAGKGAPGARPAIAAFTRAEAEAQLANIHAVFERRDRQISPIFERVLGEAFAGLPPPVQHLHRPAHIVRFTGRAQVETAQQPLAKIAAAIGGFPLRGGSVDADVEIFAEGDRELWTRKLGGKTFRSILRFDGQKMTERFGPMLFDLDLRVEEGQLKFPVLRGRAFGFLPIPSVLTPVSETSESVDADGRFTFDVRLTLPGGALIVHYKGYLEPVC